jgi:hypothetical protein
MDHGRHPRKKKVGRGKMTAAQRQEDQKTTKHRQRPTGHGTRVVPAKNRGESFGGSRYADNTSVAVERKVKPPKKTDAIKMETEGPSASPMKKYGATSPMKKYGGSPMKKNASPFAKLGSKEVDSPTTFKGDAASAINKFIGKK